MGMFAAMSAGRDHCVQARDVSLRGPPLGPFGFALATAWLVAMPSAFAQQGQPIEPPATEQPSAPSANPGWNDTGSENAAGVADPDQPGPDANPAPFPDDGAAPMAATSTKTEAAARFAEQGRQLYRRGQYAEALDEFQKAYILVPRAALAYNIGSCHERLSQYAQAIEWYNVFVRDTQDPKERAEAIKKISALRAQIGSDAQSPQARYEARMRAGKDDYRAGDFEAAIEDFKAAFDIRETPAPLYNIAKSYENMGRWEEAREYFQQYLQLDPNASDRPNVEALIKRMDRNIADRFRELVISSNPPGAEIYIDDPSSGLQGQTNTRLKLKPGPHTLYLNLNGYEPVKRDFIMPDDRDHTLDFTLTALENVGYLVVSVSEPEAQIFVDGAIVGLSPFAQKKALEAGPHQVQVRKRGFELWTGEVEVVRDQEVPLNVVLEKYDAPISDDTLSAWGSGLVLTGLIGGGIGFFTPFVIQKAFIRRPYFDQLGPERLDGDPFYRQGAPGENPGTRDNSELETMELIQTISLIAGGTLVVGGSIFYMIKWFRDDPPPPVTAGVLGDDKPLVTIDSVGVVPTPTGAAVGLSGRF